MRRRNRRRSLRDEAKWHCPLGSLDGRHHCSISLGMTRPSARGIMDSEEHIFRIGSFSWVIRKGSFGSPIEVCLTTRCPTPPAMPHSRQSLSPNLPSYHDQGRDGKHEGTSYNLNPTPESIFASMLDDLSLDSPFLPSSPK